MFDVIPQEATISGAVRFQPKGWAKPDWRIDPKFENRDTKLQDLSNSLGDTLRSLDVPSPWQNEIYKAYFAGESLIAQGLVRPDGEGAREILTSKEMGVYIYTPIKTFGVLLNKEMQAVVHFIGPKLAASTLEHEFTHADDDAAGKLTPKTKLAAEKHAFRNQYRYLVSLDPSGEILTWLRVNFGKSNPLVPDVVPDYLEHLATIRRYGDKDDWDGLIKALGYEDRETHLPPNVTRS